MLPPGSGRPGWGEAAARGIASNCAEGGGGSVPGTAKGLLILSFSTLRRNGENVSGKSAISKGNCSASNSVLPRNTDSVAGSFCQAPNHPLETLDLELEQHMLRRCLSEAEEEICRDSFDRYCEQLRAESHTLPLYPAIPLHALAERLPLPYTRRA